MIWAPSYGDGVNWSVRMAVVACACAALVVPAPAIADDSTPLPTPADAAAQPRGELPLRPGDTGPFLALLHERLSWLGYRIAADERAEARFGDSTRVALDAFAEKFGAAASDLVDRALWDDIKGTAGEVGTLPKPCTDVPKAICLNTTQRLLRLVRDGEVILTVDARFGIPGERTRRGTFSVQRRSPDHYSRLYRTSMPLALFFSGGQAIHYSPYFARDGYAGGSHGCVNLRDRAVAQRVYDWSPRGTRVHVT